MMIIMLVGWKWEDPSTRSSLGLLLPTIITILLLLLLLLLISNNNNNNNHSMLSTTTTTQATTFQRCILHRLADRFGIVRQPGSLLPGAIRLIKLPQSQVPTLLLQDWIVDMEENLKNEESNGITTAARKSRVVRTPAATTPQNENHEAGSSHHQ